MASRKENDINTDEEVDLKSHIGKSVIIASPFATYLEDNKLNKECPPYSKFTGKQGKVVEAFIVRQGHWEGEIIYRVFFGAKSRPPTELFVACLTKDREEHHGLR